jgi:hypothetical protein
LILHLRKLIGTGMNKTLTIAKETHQDPEIREVVIVITLLREKRGTVIVNKGKLVGSNIYVAQPRS